MTPPITNGAAGPCRRPRRRRRGNAREDGAHQAAIQRRAAHRSTSATGAGTRRANRTDAANCAMPARYNRSRVNPPMPIPAMEPGLPGDSNRRRTLPFLSALAVLGAVVARGAVFVRVGAGARSIPIRP
ncbi:MAG: hypothetical protein MZV64_42200 [Ignavibacteriales bacterium]|nr:hypothetical protein [Ignavibacteriales bacterium]